MRALSSAVSWPAEWMIVPVSSNRCHATEATSTPEAAMSAAGTEARARRSSEGGSDAKPAGSAEVAAAT